MDCRYKLYRDCNKNMKLTTTFTIFSLSSIFLLTILAPFVYATNQNIEIRNEGDKTVRSDMSFVDISTAIPSFPISINTKKKIIPKKESIPQEKVKIGFIQTVDSDSKQVTLLVGNVLYVVENNEATTFFFGNEDIADFETLDTGMRIYAFGYIDEASSTKMSALKIVIANKSLLRRKQATD